MRFAPLLIAPAILLTSCGGDATDPTASSPRLETKSNAADTDAEITPQNDGGYSSSIILSSPDGIEQITWEDLMPDGEEEVLAKLYEEYFTKLETSMRQRQTRLLDAGRNNDNRETDILALIAEGSAADTMDQVGTFNVVDDLNGLDIRLPGYVVPLSFNPDNEYTEFLLVPYFGACLHTPPPPPNQIVYVISDPAVKVESIYDPVWVEGTMKTGRFESDTGDSAYELTLSKIEIYEY